MNRITRYQNDIIRFIKTKNFINETSATTQRILNILLEQNDHIPAILNLTILNTQCKKNDIKIHGYYLASGIDLLMILAKICGNLDYYYNIYDKYSIENLIVDVTTLFYKCIIQNINTLRLSKEENINPKLTQLCIEYATKMLPLITRKTSYGSINKMRKTDILCMNINDKNYTSYKTKNLLEKDDLIKDMVQRYGSVCKLAMSLGWIFGQNDDNTLNKLSDLSDDKTIQKLEKLGEHMGNLLKLTDDFKSIDRDMTYEKHSLNYVVNYGIKEAYIELIKSKNDFIEGSMILDIYSETGKEIVDNIFDNVGNILNDISVDLNTQYDEVSSL